MPTLREAQAFELLALDPASETLAERCSCRFRKERPTQDAMASYFLVLSRRTSAKRILEEEVRDCFNHLDQDRLLEYIPTNWEKLRAWLRAGYLEQEGGVAATPVTPLSDCVIRLKRANSPGLVHRRQSSPGGSTVLARLWLSVRLQLLRVIRCLPPTGGG